MKSFDLHLQRTSDASHWPDPEQGIGNPLDAWPLFGLRDDIRASLEAAANRPVALATLFSVEGGAPRGIGTQMLITPEGAAGYISGGCIEADIVLHARGVISDFRPRLLVYGRGGPIDIRLPCGSRIEVLVEPIAPLDESASQLVASLHERQEVFWITDGHHRACVAEDRPDLLSNALFSRRYQPRQRVVIAGADPVTIALAVLATFSGMEVVVVRPKGPLTPPPVPGLRYYSTEPANAFSQIGLDPWTAVVAAMHDPLTDHATLVSALDSRAGYVGLLGSSRRLQDKLDRLAAAGVPQDRIATLKAPIGLPLGGRGPWEVATSILAEIMQDAAQRRGSTIATPAAAFSGPRIQAKVSA